MKNKAKCNKCNSIIESLHRTDYQTCTCNEISVYGGPDLMECAAINWNNFIRVDDNGNEIVVKVKNNTIEKHVKSKKELLNVVEELVKTIESLPPQAMNSPITHYDYLSLLMLFSKLMRCDLEN